MSEKKELSAEEIYKRNQKRAKVCKILAPICFWVFLGFAVLCLFIALKNSFGNIAEILALLDDKQYTGVELKENYNFLVQKYGQWVIGSGTSGFTITFINIGNALFSGFMVVSLVFCIIFFVSAFVVGKWLLPKLSQQITEDNQEMVNLTILKQQDKK